MAARMIEAGIDPTAFAERMTKLRGDIIGFAALETLKYVARQRSGRQLAGRNRRSSTGQTDSRALGWRPPPSLLECAVARSRFRR